MANKAMKETFREVSLAGMIDHFIALKIMRSQVKKVDSFVQKVDKILSEIEDVLIKELKYDGTGEDHRIAEALDMHDEYIDKVWGEEIYKIMVEDR